MTLFLIGAEIGVGLTLLVVLDFFKLHTKQEWREFEFEKATQRKYFDKVMAENAKLRVALAAGEMTEDGRKVAAMTMASLDAVIGTESAA